MKTTITLTSLAFTFLFISSASPASAQRSEQAEWAKAQGHRVGMEVDILSRSAQQFVGGSVEVSSFGLGLTATGQIHLGGGFHLDLEVPMANGNFSQSVEESGAVAEMSKGSFLFGNPSLGAHYTAAVTPDAALSFGLSASIPVLQDLDQDQFLAILATVPARAYFDMQRLTPEMFTLKSRVGAELRILPMLRYRGDVAPMLLFPTGNGNGDTEFFIEQGNEIEARSSLGIGGGVRFQEVFMPTQDEDGVQTAIEPFVSYEPEGPGVYARAGFLVALDEQLGFGLEQGKVATVRLAVGGKF